MNKPLSKTWKILLIGSASVVVFGCTNVKSSTTSKGSASSYGIIFHIGNTSASVLESNNSFKVIDTNQEHKRFLGWGISTTKDSIIINNNDDIPFESVKEYFINTNVIDLYAIYADLLTVNFVLETTTTYTLDSELQNKEITPYHEKDGFDFKGWSINQNLALIDLNDITYVTYNDIYPLANEKYEVSLYPVYEEKSTTPSTLKLYQYNVNDEMAEIHIETTNHLAIDDSSLIIPGEYKGKAGDNLPVYDYVGATISVNHCEKDYELNNVTGKVKVRGNYTSSYPKKPIRIKFDKKQKMLGLNNDNKLKSWVLLANWKDTSMLRDASAFYLGNAIVESDGYYTSDFRLVKVYLNDEYNGVYLLVEQQQIDAARMNIPESENATDSYKTGYLLELDGYYHNEKEKQKFTISYNDIKINSNIGFTISNDIMNDEQYNFIKKAVQNIWKVVYDACKNDHTDLINKPYHTIDDNGDYVVDNSLTTSKQAIDRVIDIKSLINMYLLHEILEDRDIGFSSFYFTLDFSENGNKKLTFNAPWDFDYAVGNNTFENAMRAKLNKSKLISEGRMTSNGKQLKATTVLTKDDFTFENRTTLYCRATDNPWFEIFSNENWIWDLLYQRYTEASEAGLFTSLLKMIETYTVKYENAFNENFEKWPNAFGVKLSALQPDEITYFVTQKQAGDYLRIWLEERIDGLGYELNRKAEQY